MKTFVQKCVKGERCNAFNQHYKSEISNEVFNNISKELNVNGNPCDLLVKYFGFSIEYGKLYAKGFDSKKMIIETLIKRQRLEISTKSLTLGYLFIKNCQN